MRKLFVMLSCVMFLAACGGGGSSTNTPAPSSTNLTVSGTVSGTTFVAVDASTNTETGRKVASLQSDGSKKFSLTIPTGKTYKFYLIENEGTTSERVYPLYNGAVNKFAMTTTSSLDLGYISTATGVAVPTTNMATISGCTASGEDKVIPTAIASSQSYIYSASDLAGTWNMIKAQTGTTPFWSHGIFTIGTDGVLQATTTVTSAGPGTVAQDTLSISPSGVVTAPSNSSFRGVMNRDKNLIIGTETKSGTPAIVALAKTGGSFTLADMQGTWKYHSLILGTSSIWRRGIFTFDNAGNATFTNITNSDGLSSTDKTIPSFAISSQGIVTNPSIATYYGVVASNKNFMVATNTNSDGTIVLGVYVKVGGSGFSAADMKGTWSSNNLIVGSTNSWLRQLTTIDATGLTSSFEVVQNGVAEANNSSTTPLTIGTSGILTVGTSTLEGILSLDKGIGVFTSTSGTTNRLGIIVK